MSIRSNTRACTRALAATSSYLTTSCAPLVLAACVGSTWPALAFAETAPQDATQSDAIIVTASPIAGAPDRFATIVTQVNRDAIVQSGGSNLSDALRDVPGVANTGFAAGASRPVIRGMDATRVKVLEDGLSSSDVSDIGPDHGVPIDPLSARSIEVVRGAATLRYGSQAIGGVVNAINNRVPLSLPAAPLSGEASASYGSSSAATDGSVLLDARAGQFAFHADGFARRTSDYGTPDGTQTNSFFHGDGYSGGVSYFFGDNDASRTGLSVTHYDARYGIPSDTTFIDMRQTKVQSGSSFHVGAGPVQTVNLDVGYGQYAHDEVAPDGTINSTFKNREYDGRAEAMLGPMGPLSATAIGVQYSRRAYSALGDDSTYLFPTLTTSGAAFAFTEAPLGGHAHLQAAARVEQVRIEGTPASDALTHNGYTPVSGSVGVLFDVSDAVKLGVTLTSAARAPGQTELFARGGHDGPETFETGDPNLKMERANSIEATLRLHQDRFAFEGSLWDASFSNYIFGFLTGNLCTDDGDCTNQPGAELKQLFYRQQDANFWGAEGRGTYDIARFTSGTLQGVALADIVRAKFADGGGDVPRIQPYRIGGGLNWVSGPFNAGFLALFVGKQDHVPAGDTETDAYWNLDAQASWRPFSARSGFEVALVGHNLTDEVQRNAVSLNRDVVEMPGRDIRLVLRQSF